MAKTAQLLAVVGGVVNETKARMAQLVHVATQPNLFEGSEITYQKRFEDDRSPDFAPQYKKVRITADELVKAAQEVLTRNWDLALTLDTANAKASADVIVDGKVLLEKVPVGHLLWLDKELAELQKLVEALPERSPALNWTEDGQAAGIAKADPVYQDKREKVPGKFVLYEATKEHPAQVQRVDKDDVIGRTTQVNFSGAVSAKRKEDLLARLTRVRQAVKMAREDANTVVAPDQHEGEKVFGYLLAP
jgi:hypothetical protein